MLIFKFLVILLCKYAWSDESYEEIEPGIEVEECKDILPSEICNHYEEGNYCQKPGYLDFVKYYCPFTCKHCNEGAVNETYHPNEWEEIDEGKSFQCGRRNLRFKRIVGGTNAKLGNWPWQVNIEHRNNIEKHGHYCGGSLINNKWVISAAHCFYHDENPENFWVRLGEVDLDNPGDHVQAVRVKKLVLHPKYDNHTYDNDIALLKLGRKIKFNKYIYPVCLPPAGLEYRKGKNCHITGWGNVNEYKNGPKILQQANVKPISRKRCVKKFRKYKLELTQGMVCTGTKRKRRPKDSCYGDSGGPLVCTSKKYRHIWYLFGIISWGIGCGRKEFFGVQTNVKFYSRWIERQMKN